MTNVTQIQPTKNIHQRMLEVYKEVTSIQKEDKKVNNQYTFVSHDAVTKELHMPLAKHGICPEVSMLSCKQEGNRTEVKVRVRFVNADNEDNFIEGEFYGYGIDSQDKGPGKATSYAVKTAFLKNFCLESAEEDNEKSHMDYKPSSSPKVTPPKIYINHDQIEKLRSIINQSELSEKEFLSKSKLEDLKYLEVDRYEGAIQYLKANIPQMLNGHHEGATQ